MQPISFDFQVKFYNDQVHKNKKIPPFLSLQIFKFLSQNHAQPLKDKTIRQLKRLSKHLLPHTPRLAHLIQQFILKDDCSFKRLPLDVRKLICSHLDVRSIQNIACFIGNYTLRIIEWNNNRQGSVRNLNLKEKSIYRVAHEVKGLILDGSLKPFPYRFLCVATRLQSLDLRCSQPADLECLNQCVTLTSLKSLTIEAAKLNTIAKSKSLTNLTALSLISRRKIDLEIDLSNFHFLKKLSIERVTLGRNCVEKLFNNESLRNLEELNFCESFVWQHSMDLLVRSQILGNLRTLRITNGSVSIQEFVGLLESSTLSNLTQLAIEDEGHYFYTKPTCSVQKILRNLRKLSLSHSYMNPSFETFFQLDLAQNFSQLQELNFSCHDDLPFMWFPLLTKVTLIDCRIDDDKFKQLSTTSVWSRLVELNLQSNSITTTGTVYFNSSTLQNLTYLDLENNLLTDKGVEAIITAPAMQELITLKVKGNPITPMVAQYTKFFPGLHTS